MEHGKMRSQRFARGANHNEKGKAEMNSNSKKELFNELRRAGFKRTQKFAAVTTYSLTVGSPSMRVKYDVQIWEDGHHGVSFTLNGHGNVKPRQFRNIRQLAEAISLCEDDAAQEAVKRGL